MVMLNRKSRRENMAIWSWEWNTVSGLHTLSATISAASLTTLITRWAHADAESGMLMETMVIFVDNCYQIKYLWLEIARTKLEHAMGWNIRRPLKLMHLYFYWMEISSHANGWVRQRGKQVKNKKHSLLCKMAYCICIIYHHMPRYLQEQ